MAKQRYINTKFWDDEYITSLKSNGKLLYIYFLTNTLTSICGIYEISIRRMVFDTKINKNIIISFLEKFEKDGKVKYKNGWIAIKNFMKHQKQSDNPKDKINIGIKAELQKLPKTTLDWIKEQAPCRGLVRGSNYSNSNSNSNSNIYIPEHSSDKHSKEKKLHSGLVGNKLTSKEGDSDVVWDTHAKIYQYLNELSESGEKISTNGSKKFKILAYYAILSKTKLENKAQWSSFVKRNIRIAGRLVEQGFECKKICFTSFLLESKSLSWSLESIEKWITRLDSELLKQSPEEEEKYKDLYQELKVNLKKLNNKYGTQKRGK